MANIIYFSGNDAREYADRICEVGKKEGMDMEIITLKGEADMAALIFDEGIDIGYLNNLYEKFPCPDTISTYDVEGSSWSPGHWLVNRVP